MPYTYITFLQARAQLAKRLNDPSKLFWADAELGRYLIESIRTFNSGARYFKDKTDPLPTVASTSFYDLTSLSQLDYNVTDQDLVGLIQHQFLEPYEPTVWTGSNQFMLEYLTEALQRRRNQFLLETGMVLTHSTPAMPSPPINKVELSDSVIGVRWLWFLDSSTGIYTPLWRIDEFGEEAYAPTWRQTQDTPESYSVVVMPPTYVHIIPAPNNSGTLDMLSITAPANLDPSSGVFMNMPDDFTWAVRFGAMADLLNMDSLARDPLRAQYCEQRYREGVELARMASSVLTAQINDEVVGMCSLEELGSYYPTWRDTPGVPDMIAMAGFNMIAVAKVPDGIYSMTFDVVKNATVPDLADDAAYIQLGREELDAVLGYAQHLASFKMGGAEFVKTFPLYEQFIRLISVYNETIRANAVFWDALKDRAIRPKESKPYRKSESVTVENV